MCGSRRAVSAVHLQVLDPARARVDHACVRRRSGPGARIRAGWAMPPPREGLAERPVRVGTDLRKSAIGNKPFVTLMSHILMQRAGCVLMRGR